MARIPIYKNSFLASSCSILGYIIVIGGVVTAISEDIIGGIILIISGFVLMFLAKNISENKQFKKWKKQINRKGDISVIENSIQGAIQVFNTYPCKKSLEYIRTLNPQAAEFIDQELLAKKNQ